MIAIGDPAPDFTLATTDGEVKLSDFRGRKLLIYFYPKDDTSGCTAEARDFSALVDAFAAADTALLGVSRDTLAAHQRFAAKYDLKLPLGSDPEAAVIAAYGAWVEKSMYGRKYMGIDRSTFLIDRDGRIAALWRKVKVPGHAAAALKAAQELG